MYIGEYRIDDYVTLIATTHRFSSGAAYAPTSITYRVYEDATDVEIVADTAMTNFDTETGFYLNRIQCTAALGYEAGKTYTALIKATVDSVAAITAYTWRILTPPVNVTQVSGTVQTAGDLATMITAVDDLVDTEVAAIKTKTDYLPSVTAGTAGGLMIAGSNAATTVNITGNLSGSVGSVTGAVGSVTGDVGGNVTGSVGSIASNGINNNSLHPNACSKITDSGIQRGASNWENNSDDRSLGWAISKLVNKIDLNAAGDTLTIRKSNDSTALFTQAVTTSGGAAPVVSLDTTG